MMCRSFEQRTALPVLAILAIAAFGAGCTDSSDGFGNLLDAGDALVDTESDGNVDDVPITVPDVLADVDARATDTADSEVIESDIDTADDIEDGVDAADGDGETENDIVEDGGADTGDTDADDLDADAADSDADAEIDGDTTPDSDAEIDGDTTTDSDGGVDGDTTIDGDVDAVTDGDAASLVALGGSCDDESDCESGECSVFGAADPLCTEACDETCGTDGFECFGGYCLPVDFCAEDVNFGPACAEILCGGECGDNAICVNDEGGAPICVCVAGFEGDGAVCTDINECLTENGGCGDPQFTSCVNRTADTPLCEDINECLTENGGCGPTEFVTCRNENGGEPTCIDILECDDDNGGCGSAEFTRCVEQQAAAPLCEDINECDTDNGGCGPVAFVTCENARFAGPTCVDILECAIDNGDCGPVDRVRCVEQNAAAAVCEDINECETDNGGCGDELLVECVNQDGAAPLCNDINECLVDNGGCGDAALVDCINESIAEPTCADVLECEVANGGCGDATFTLCVEQYGAEPTCEDIDECEIRNGGCGPVERVTCVDQTGAEPLCNDVLECLVDNGGCPVGFSTCREQFGAAPVCEDILECASNNGGCEPGFATCVEQNGAAPVCLDINECLDNNGGCGSELLYDCVNNTFDAPTCLPLFSPGDLDPLFGADGFATLPAAGALSERAWDMVWSANADRIYLVGDSRTGAFGTPECLVMSVSVTGDADTGFGTAGREVVLPDGQVDCRLRAASVSDTGSVAVAGGTADATRDTTAIGMIGSTTFDVVGSALPGDSLSATARAVTWSGGSGLFSVVDSFTSGASARTGRVLNTSPAGVSTATFGSNGFSEIGSLDAPGLTVVNDLALLDSDTLIVAGTNENQDGEHTAFLASVDPTTGALNAEFGTEGAVLFSISDIACRFTSVAVTSEYIYAAGSADFGLNEDVLVVRFDHAGAEVPFATEPGYFRGSLVGRDIAYDMAVDSAGRLVVAGEYDLSGLAQPAVVRLLPDGSVDLNFGLSTFGRTEFAGEEAEAWAIDLLDDDSILVAGRSRTVATGIDRPFLARLLP